MIFKNINLKLISLLLHLALVNGYDVPKAKIEVFYPKGFQVSIAHEPGITLFGFHGKLNEEFDGFEAGKWAYDVHEQQHGRWTYKDRKARLQKGDTLYYWTYVVYNGKGYFEEDGVYTVNEYDSHPSKPNCKRAQTEINNDGPRSCIGEIIFLDNFDQPSLDSANWKLERRFPTEPDYEFNMYLDDAADVLKISDGVLNIKPKPTINHFSNMNGQLNQNLNLGYSCTARKETEDCVFASDAHKILPPFISAQLTTKERFSFKYGRIVVRAQLPKADWVYPQLWLQPLHQKYGPDYQSGQMRIAYSRSNGGEADLYGGVMLNAMEPWRSKNFCKKTTKDGGSRSNWVNDFHIYELIWTPQHITLLVDDEEFCKISIGDMGEALCDQQQPELPNRALLKNGTKLAPFDQPFFVTIGYGIGGHRDFDDSHAWHVPKPWTNTSPKALMSFWRSVKDRIDQWLNGGELKVDYVKIYAV